MRNLLSLESVNVSPAAVLSLEEEAVVISEVVADNAAIDAELTEVARATDVSESLEDLAVIADNIDEATPVEGALFDTAANMAVAGTDVEPTALVPASESFKGRKLATESQGLKDRAKAIWVQIKEALKRIWARIEAFFYKYFGTLPGLKRDIEAARKKVQAAGGQHVEKDKAKFTLSSGLHTLTVDGAVVKNGSDLVKKLGVFNTVVSYTFNDNGEAKKFGEIFHDALSNFDSAAPNDQVIKAVKAMSEAGKNVKGPLSSGGSFSKRYPGYSVQHTEPFFGNTSIIVKVPEKDAGSMSPVQGLTYLSKMGCFNVPTTDKTPSTPDSVEFQTLTISEMDSVLDSCFSLVSTLESYQRGKSLKDAQAYKEKLASASEKASAAVARLEVSDDTNDRAAVAAYRALINLNTVYCNMLANPSTGLATNVQTTVRTMLSLVSKSLAQYK